MRKFQLITIISILMFSGCKTPLPKSKSTQNLFYPYAMESARVNYGITYASTPNGINQNNSFISITVNRDNIKCHVDLNVDFDVTTGRIYKKSEIGHECYRSEKKRESHGVWHEVDSFHDVEVRKLMKMVKHSVFMDDDSYGHNAKSSLHCYYNQSSQVNQVCYPILQVNKDDTIILAAPVIYQ
jgi:hypothetical protein